MKGAGLEWGAMACRSWYKWGREWMEMGCVEDTGGGSKWAEAGGKPGWSYSLAYQECSNRQQSF